MYEIEPRLFFSRFFEIEEFLLLLTESDSPWKEIYMICALA